MAKEHPERVDPTLARRALAQSHQRTEVYSQYIALHFRSTGDLAPGCDARDLYAYLEQNHPQELTAITGIKKEKRNAHKGGNTANPV